MSLQRFSHPTSLVQVHPKEAFPHGWWWSGANSRRRRWQSKLRRHRNRSFFFENFISKSFNQKVTMKKATKTKLELTTVDHCDSKIEPRFQKSIFHELFKKIDTIHTSLILCHYKNLSSFDSYSVFSIKRNKFFKHSNSFPIHFLNNSKMKSKRTKINLFINIKHVFQGMLTVLGIWGIVQE